jgi:3-dehydroquinate dehydratase-2
MSDALRIVIINGPNLNLTGIREKGIYGEISFDEYLVQLRKKFSGLDIEYFQSNIEGEIIDKLHETGFDYDGIILNAGAYTHTSLAIADAIAGIQTPVIEVHISNIYSREKIRHQSLISSKCKGRISGFGLNSYELAILSFMI